jgi:hypothetical protein
MSFRQPCPPLIQAHLSGVRLFGVWVGGWHPTK